MSDLLFEYKVRARHRLGFKEFSFYATTDIEEFLNRNSIDYVRNATDTVENRLFKEIERLNKKIEQYENPEDMTLMFMWCDEKAKDEIKRLNNIINTILEFDFFKSNCPLDFSYTEKCDEDEAQNVFYEDDYCEKTCNDNYKKCWLKYFKELQELKGSDK